MNKKDIHFGGSGVVSTQPLAWSSAFNPYNKKTYLNGDSPGDRRLARVNQMRALLDTPPVGSFFEATFNRR
jgi:hypothetical protein